MKSKLFFLILIFTFFANNLVGQKSKKSKIRRHEKVVVETENNNTSNVTLDMPQLPNSGPLPTIKIEQAENFTLSNGLKVYVLKNIKLPQVLFSLTMDIEPHLEGQYAGLGKTVGLLLATGTKRRTKAQFDKESDFIGAKINTTITSINASALSTQSEKLMDLMSDVVLNPNFTQSELDKIKKQLKAELVADKDNPNTIANKIAQVVLYGKDHPYGEQMTNNTIDNITLDACNKYYNTYFKPNLGYLAVVGDITTIEAKVIVEKYFSNWQKAEVHKALTATARQTNKTEVIIVDKPNAVQSTISIVNIADLKIGSPDAIKARITNDILGGENARLFNNLCKKHAYTNGVYSTLSSDRKIGKFSADASVPNAVTEISIIEIMKELNGLVTTKPTIDELNRTKNAIAENFILSLEKPQTIADFAINTARYNLPSDYYTNYLKDIDATTIYGIQAIANKYIKPQNCIIIVIGKAADFAEKLKKFGNIEYYDVDGNKINTQTFPKTVTPASITTTKTVTTPISTATDKTVTTPTTITTTKTATTPKSIAIDKTATTPISITTDKIIEKYIVAIGGRDKILAVKDIEMNLSGNMPNGPAIAITISKKTPNKSLQVVKVMGSEIQKTVIDGLNGTIISKNQVMVLKETELIQALAKGTLFYELDPIKAGIKTTLLAPEKAGGIDCNKIEFSVGEAKWIEYYNTKTNLKVRSVENHNSANGITETVIEYSNYKAINGLQFPTLIKQNIGKFEIELNLDNVKINTGIEDKEFTIK